LAHREPHHHPRKPHRRLRVSDGHGSAVVRRAWRSHQTADDREPRHTPR
jgi:hypothetical protein